MKKLFTSLAVLVLCSTTAALAQTAATQLTPAAQRISDQAIQADHDAFKGLQGRLHQLNERGVPVRDYHLAKAQCWLDVSLHEYTRNDRSAFPQAAMTESEKLIVALENKVTPLPRDTPLVNDAARLRPDLWARTDALKQHPGFKCAAQQVACAEVELVHAGNEHNQQQWRHAKPSVQIAEELVSEANQLVAQCLPAPAALLIIANVPPQPVALQARVLFDFDKYSANHIRPDSRAELDLLMARAKLEGITINTLSLVGHADRLNSTGNAAYNQQLSQKRVNTVRDLLAAQGLVVSSVAIDARGDREQLETCERQFKKPSELQACLLPNRRVQVELTGTKRAVQP